MPKSTVPISTVYEPGAAAAMIPLSVPHLAGREAEYLRACIDDNFVSSVGAFVDRFEREMAARIGTSYAVATVTGTAAIHVALLAAGLQPDDEVLAPALTFVAPVNAIRYCNAWPVLVDVDPEYWQLDPDKVEVFLRDECWRDGTVLRNRATGRRVAGLLPVDILGHPCDMDRLLSLASRYGLFVVEDATESLGAEYSGAPVGSRAPIACFSFNGNKIITTGGGGMVVTNDADVAARVKYLTTQAKDDPIEFVHNEIGFNYRLTNLQAAVGCAQLEQLETFVAAKRRIANRYADTLSALTGVRVMAERQGSRSSRWLYTVLIDSHAFGLDSREVMRSLGAQNIQTRPLWCPIHRLPAHRGAQAFQVVEADRLNAMALSLPSSTCLTDSQQQKVIDELFRLHASH